MMNIVNNTNVVCLKVVRVNLTGFYHKEKKVITVRY